MKFTNKSGLPLPLVRAIQKISEQYDPGESDYTATGLLKPARMVALERKYEKEIAVEAKDSIKSVIGTSVHHMLEMAAEDLPDFIVEKRFYIEVDGVKVGAKIDLFDTKSGTLYDWKTTSVYSVRRGLKEEHAQQLNIGAEGLRLAGHTVNVLKVAYFPTDYREWEKEKFEWYPKEYSEVEVPIVPREEVLSFIRDRIQEMKAAEKDLPRCSKEETWGGRRCEKYCSVSKMCDQYKQSKKEKK